MVGNRKFRILTVNSGSSSLKFSLYEMGESEALVLSGRIERIGLRGGLFYIKNANDEILVEQHREFPDHDAAIKVLFDWLHDYAPGQSLDAAGHRVVHGGSQYNEPQLISPELVTTLKAIIPLAPDHLPHELKAIKAVSQYFPTLKQVACFDTAFHRHMPKIAQLYPLPKYLWQERVIRYGFHGLSYEYIMNELRDKAGIEVASGRVIIAHLGNGASMTAIHRGKSTDTTMGFTPAGGLMMSTRSGDLDPGVILYLLAEKGFSASTLNQIVNQQAGLIGVSGVSSDMRDLLMKAAENAHAAEAVELFCYQAKKFLGAFVAVLGGLDTLIFTGGIGENAPSIRWRICKDMGFLGIHLDSDRNDASAPIISHEQSSISVWVMKTNEELMVARHTYKLLQREAGTEKDQGF